MLQMHSMLPHNSYSSFLSPEKSVCVYTHLFIKHGEVFKGLCVMLSKASVHAEFKNKMNGT